MNTDLTQEKKMNKFIRTRWVGSSRTFKNAGLVEFGRVWSSLVLSGLVESGLVSSHLIRSGLVRSGLVGCSVVWSGRVRSSRIWSGLFRSYELELDHALGSSNLGHQGAEGTSQLDDF